METGYITITELSSYLNIKTKTIYAMVESGDIPHYRIGRLIRFKMDEIDTWMASKKAVKVDPDQKVKCIMRSIRKPSVDVQRIVKKTIDQVKGASYSIGHGKSDQTKGLTRKEVEHGSI